jgi:hypothetical protein
MSEDRLTGSPKIMARSSLTILSSEADCGVPSVDVRETAGFVEANLMGFWALLFIG